MKEIYQNEILNNWVEKDESTEKTNHRFKELSKIMDPVYEYILSYSNYYSVRRNYGVGRKLTMLEVHYLTDIYDHPAITVTQIANKWKRSTSAISRTINKLIKFGYIERKINADDAKIFNLYTTEIGEKIAISHKKYDNLDIVKTQKKLLESFSVDELIVFNKVCQKYSEILEDNIKKNTE